MGTMVLTMNISSIHFKEREIISLTQNIYLVINYFRKYTFLDLDMYSFSQKIFLNNKILLVIKKKVTRHSTSIKI